MLSTLPSTSCQVWRPSQETLSSNEASMSFFGLAGSTFAASSAGQEAEHLGSRSGSVLLSPQTIHQLLSAHHLLLMSVLEPQTVNQKP